MEKLKKMLKEKFISREEAIPRKMKVTIEANAIIQGDSVSLYPRRKQRYKDTEPIDNNLEVQHQE